MTAGRTVPQKVGDWKVAYDAIREEMTMPEMRAILAAMQSNDQMRDLPLYIQLARLVSANDRAAGTIAALITQTGIKPTAFNYGDDE